MILVTGANGRLGKALVTQARAQGLPVVGLDLAPSDYARPCDLRRDALEPLMAGVSAVIHCAALHGRHLDLGFSRQAFVDTNIGATLRLLEAAKNQGVGRFIYTSTTSLYGRAMEDDRQAVWVDEQLPVAPRDIYDITKQAAEALCRDFFEKDFVTAALRVSRFMDEPANAIANYRLYRGLDERDGARAHLKALTAPLARFEIFNVSNQSPFTRADCQALKEDAAAVIRRCYPQAELVYRQKGWQLPASIDRVYDITKARQMLGYEPQFNFETLLSH